MKKKYLVIMYLLKPLSCGPRDFFFFKFLWGEAIAIFQFNHLCQNENQKKQPQIVFVFLFKKCSYAIWKRGSDFKCPMVLWWNQAGNEKSACCKVNHVFWYAIHVIFLRKPCLWQSKWEKKGKAWYEEDRQTSGKWEEVQYFHQLVSTEWENKARREDLP